MTRPWRRGPSLAGWKRELTARRDAHAGRAGELAGEIERLLAGGHDTPPVPHTRAPGVRDDRAGAPLWKVTDFAPDVPDEHRAGLEAALEAAGLLDAWVTPDGNLVDGDVTVVSGLAPVPGQSCASALIPAIDPGDPQARTLSGEAVRSVLSAIGLGRPNGTARSNGTAALNGTDGPNRTGSPDGTGAPYGTGRSNGTSAPDGTGGPNGPAAPDGTWVSADGRWANGVLGGAWRKDGAGYIGEGAREGRPPGQDRAAHRGTDIRSARRSASSARRWPTSACAVSGSRDEHRAVPPDAAVREAHTVAAAERRRRGELREQHARAVTETTKRQEALAAARTRAEEFARDVGLPAEPDELGEVKAGVADYRLALAGLWPAAEASHGAVRAADEAAAELADSQGRLEDATEAAATVREEASAAQAMYEALRETAGAAVEELYQQLEGGPARPRTAAPTRRPHVAASSTLSRERGKADGERGAACAQDIDEATQARDAAVAEFQSFAATASLRVALPVTRGPRRHPGVGRLRPPCCWRGP